MSDLSAQFPFDVQQVHGSHALAELERLRQLGPAEGFTPVLLGSDEELPMLLEGLEHEDDNTPIELIARAEEIDIEAWFRQRVEAYPDYYGDLDFQEESEDVDPVGIIVHLDLVTRKPKSRVYIAKVPTPLSWQVPAHLKLGGWNECPSAEEQVAISRYWHERYGAEVIAATHDVVQYMVSNPPTDRVAAEVLAREQFIYCPDIVDQGVQTVANLAAALQGDRTWYFWWD